MMTLTPTAIDTAIESKPNAKTKHFLSIDGLTTDELGAVFAFTDTMKPAIREPGHAWSGALSGKSAVLLFEKPSLRTRVSFEVGLTKLGAHVMYFDQSKQRIGQRESIKDYAKNLERWVDLVVARTFEHDTLAGLAEHSAVPVVNALSDVEHPCQALADLYTLKERFGSLDGLKVAYVGDGNNVCHSLLLLAAKLGVSVTVVSPKGFEPQFSVVQRAVKHADKTGATITLAKDLGAVEGHHAIYTDTWVSMGQDHQTGLRDDAFAGFQVDAEVMALASSGLDAPSVFMHCLPAHRGEEVTDEVIDSPESLVYDQAENRMHVQNALVAKLMGVE